MNSSPEPAAGESSVLPLDSNTSSRRRTYFLLALGLVIFVGAGWRYRITRLDYRMARAKQAIESGDTKAARDYGNVIEAAGHLEEAALVRGEAYLKFGSPDLALSQFNKINPDGPLRGRVIDLTGLALFDLGEMRDAYRILRIVVTEDPANVEAFRRLAIIDYDLGRLDKAVDHLTRVAELDVADARPHRLMGLIHKDLSELPNAEAAYREALRRGLPTDKEQDVRLELAETLTRLTRYADGLEMVLNSANADLYEERPIAVRAECLRSLGRAKESNELLQKAIVKHPCALFHRLLGQAYYDLAELNEAAKHLEEALKLEAYDQLSYFLLAQVYNGLGRAADAAKMQAKEKELKQIFERLTDLTNVAMSNPWDGGVRLELAKVYEDINKPEFAAMWKKAAEACGAKSR